MELDNTVKALLEIMVKKKVLLSELEDYSKRQKTLLMQSELDTKAFNNIMSNKKVRIDILNKLESETVAAYEAARPILETQTEDYRAAIADLKILNESICQLGDQIHDLDQKNESLLKGKAGNVKSEAKSFRQHKTAMKHYQNNYNSQQKVDGPHFFEAKK